MAYATNLPYQGKPRGLGELGHQAAGFGTWVVDMHWGLSPKHIGGQNRPYGPNVINTFYPRSQDPRLLNLSMGPVVPGGSWPELVPTMNMPVFRTPLARSGQKQESLPPLGLQGYGYLPLGIAQPPYELLGRGEHPGAEQPYERMPAMFRGFGQGGDSGIELEVGTQRIALNPADLDYARSNPGEIQRILLSLTQALVATEVVHDRYTRLASELTVTGHPSPYQTAAGVIFGSAAAQAQNAALYNALGEARGTLAATFSPEEIATWDATLQAAFRAFMGGTGSFRGYGDESWVGPAIGAGVGVAILSGGYIAAGTAGVGGLTISGWLAGAAGIPEPISKVIVVVVILVTLVAGTVAAVKASGLWPAAKEAASGAQTVSMTTESASRERLMMFRMQQIARADTDLKNATTPDERQRAQASLAFWRGAVAAAPAQSEADADKIDKAGGWAAPQWLMQGAVIALAGIMAYFAYRSPRGGDGSAKQTVGQNVASLGGQVQGSYGGPPPAPKQTTWTGALKDTVKSALGLGG